MAVVTLSAALVACQLGSNSRSPESAQDFEIKLFANENHLSGEIVKLSDYEGQQVVINFWYPSCPPCRLEIPDFEAAWQGFKQQKVQLIGVQVPGFDSFDDGQAFVNELNLTYTIGATSDTKLVMKYDLQGFPTTVFLNADHEVVRKWTGVLNSEKLSELVSESAN